MRPPNPLRLAITTSVMVLALSACSDPDADDGSVAAAPTGSDEATTTASTSDAATSQATGTSASTETETSTSAPASTGDPEEIVTYVVEVVDTYPHDTAAYTQGLEVVDDLLLESTGVRGESSIRLVEPETGEIVQSTALDPNLFGEGATIVGDEVWQLTWTSGILLVHGLDDLSTRRQLIYAGEGWGLCAMDDRLVMSDGSSLLTSRDRETFEVIDQVQVLDDGEPLGKINELECVDGVVWANIFQSTQLVAIDPSDGRVTGRADLVDLVPDGFEGDGTNVPNGIAHDPDSGRFYLTGKRWPVLYEVELVPLS